MTIKETIPRLDILRRLITLGGAWKGDLDTVVDIFLTAVQEFCDQDLQRGYDLLITGRIPEYKGDFCPGPPLLARACRTAQAERLDHERIMRGARQSNLPPPAVKVPGSKERIAKYIATGDRSVLM